MRLRTIRGVKCSKQTTSAFVFIIIFVFFSSPDSFLCLAHPHRLCCSLVDVCGVWGCTGCATCCRSSLLTLMIHLSPLQLPIPKRYMRLVKSVTSAINQNRGAPPVKGEKPKALEQVFNDQQVKFLSRMVRAVQKRAQSSLVRSHYQRNLEHYAV